MSAIAGRAPFPDETLQRAREGDGDAFAEIVREHQAMVYSIVWNILGNRDTAEEIAQDVFLQLYRNLRGVESSSHLLHWLRQVTSRKCIDALRRKRPAPVNLEEVNLIAVPQESDHFLQRRLRRLVGDLSDTQRVVLTLRYQEDLGPAEIAEIVGMRVNSVKSVLHRTVLLLRNKLGESQ